MNSLIKTEQVGRVRIARLDNPPHALMTEPMVRELDALVRRADADDGIGVVPAAELVTAVLATARRLATRFKPAVGVIKRAVLEGGSLPLEQGLQIEVSGFLAMLGEPTVQEAMAAYGSYIERNGDLPAGDMGARRQLENGEFVAFYGS